MYTLLGFALLVAIFAVGYVVGRTRRYQESSTEAPVAAAPPPPAPASAPTAPPAALAETAAPALPAEEGAVAERARIIRSFEHETADLRRALVRRDAMLTQLRQFAAERERLFGQLAAVRADIARYRQLVIDLENNAPPPLLGGPGMPDDLKLIVGVGPVLERMLHQLGVTTYKQIARWSERDIDDVDARLPEFPGRIRRDAWVTQARALYQSTYGEPVPARDRA